MFIASGTPNAEFKRKKFESLRGATVSAFANTEFLIKSYLISISNRSDFECSGGYSHKIDTLLKNFRTSFRDPIFPKEVSVLANDLIDSFESVIDDRNQFVHGRARLIYGGKTVEMLRYLPSSENKHRIIRSTYQLNELESRVQNFDKICRELIAIILNLDNSFKLGIVKEV